MSSCSTGRRNGAYTSGQLVDEGAPRVCEILAIRSAEPFRLGSMLALAEPLDAWGDTGHGWGVAWLEPDADRVKIYKRPLALIQDSAPYAAIGDRPARVA